MSTTHQHHVRSLREPIAQAAIKSIVDGITATLLDPLGGPQGIPPELVNFLRSLTGEAPETQAPEQTVLASAPPIDAQEALPIGIVGGGVSGLYAAMILQSLGLKYEILEASDRIGGRIFTHRFNPNPQDGINAEVGNPERYDYIDMGAMRFPQVHFMDRVFDLFKRVDVKRLEIEYKMTATNELLYYNGQRVNRSDKHEMEKDDVFKVTDANGGFVPEPYVQIDNTGGAIMDYLLGPFIAEFDRAQEITDDDLFRQAMKKAWAKVIKFDQYSLRGFMLRDAPWQAEGQAGGTVKPAELEAGGSKAAAAAAVVAKLAGTAGGGLLPESVVEWLESMGAGTGMYNHAFTEAVMEALDFGDINAATHAAPRNEKNGGYDWKCLDGGSDRVILGMLTYLKDRREKGPESEKKKPVVETRKRVIGIRPRKENPTVMEVDIDGEAKPREYSQVICTVALGCLSSIDLTECGLSYAQKTAVRSLTYLASTKVAVKFAKRWWEDPEVMGKNLTIEGGVTSTDLPSRMIVYPSYGLKVPNAPGVIIGSYNWAQDASRFGSLAADRSTNSPLLKIVLDDLSRVHNVPVSEMGEVVDWYPHAWYNDPYTRGAFAYFGPGQFGTTDYHGFSLFAAVQAPAAGGRLHFAGEATSIHHAWVLGALNAAWRAVYNVLQRDIARRKELIREWGTPDEFDLGYLEKVALLGTFGRI